MKNRYKISHTQKRVFIHINKILHVDTEDQRFTESYLWSLCKPVYQKMRNTAYSKPDTFHVYLRWSIEQQLTKVLLILSPFYRDKGIRITTAEEFAQDQARKWQNRVCEHPAY